MPEYRSTINHPKKCLKVILAVAEIDTDACILWPFSVFSNGYGRVWFDGKYWGVHRLTYKLLKPDFDDSLLVLHRCDTRRCYNLKHLFQGSQLVNMQDMDSKGRRKSKASNIKFTAEQVLEIRAQCESGRTMRAIAAEFDTTCSNVLAIIRRQTWKHI